MERLLNVLTVFSVALLLQVLVSLRRAHIRVEHSVSWLGAALALLALSRSRATLAWISAFLGIGDPPLALLMLVFCVFLVILYRLSAIISELKDANIAMAQRVAILEFHLRSTNEEQQSF